MKMYVAGQWVEGHRTQPVLNPFDGSVVDTVPMATADDVERALAAAVRGAGTMRRLPAYERARILRRAADLLAARSEEFARTITLEEGKIIKEARTEVARAVEVLALSAEEGKRLYGEVVPLDAAPGVTAQFGFTIRVPCGVVVAISPFNFPLNLVMHKVGPALAAGNSVIIKPASDTPLSALKLVEVLLEAGVPAEGVQCVTGSGREVGEALCADPRVRKVTFTGSRDVGERICKVAGLKRVTMELGSNSPVIVMPDADLERAAAAIASTGYANAGQVCISAQRIIGLRPIYGELIDALRPKVEAIRVGNPLEEQTAMGPLVREAEAKRVETWVREAVAGGARVVVGGERRGALYPATVVADVDPRMRLSRDELFGPAVALTPAGTIDEAIALANDSAYGLAASIFTRDLDRAMRFAREVESGNIHVNWGPQWRADLMPYGGLKESGFGKEGPRYAVAEMTETKMVVLHVE
ncbi:MAG: aldehyde dehydrogenase family protein [Armatimonadota bacterium]|nr:aldehyde dehydrogenase family protein [Armatimonadota bacterium]MDR7423151.1 aldehyde dehydrogenase family protein [Armatimonadota bacterium]MDR7511315.1 aldehyde dehydrogenase family protein [Armatimonadota bacterium]